MCLICTGGGGALRGFIKSLSLCSVVSSDDDDDEERKTSSLPIFHVN